MRIGKLDITNWRWEHQPGNWYKLRRVDEIVRAIVFWPVMQLLRVLLCLTVAAGQGVEEAHDMWQSTR